MKNNVEQITHPFFSIIIPVYNKEPHIARSIKSVLNQSYKNFELIIVCDPSTDNSNIEVENFSDSRIRLFYRDKPGPGGYAARNLGIKQAKSEWIAFLDADDEWYLDYLYSVKITIESTNKPSFIATGWETFDPITEMSPKINSYHVKNSNKGLHTLNFKEYLNLEIDISRPFYTSTAVINKTVLMTAGLFPAGKAKKGGDVDTWLRCIFECNQLTVNNYIGACYYRDSVNMVTRNSTDNASHIRESIKQIINQVRDKETVVLLKKLSNYYSRSIWSSNYYSTSYQNNYDLFKVLYYEVDTVKMASLGAVSLLPDIIILKIRDAKAKLKKIIDS